MYFAFHINTDKSSRTENKEAVAVTVSRTDPDYWIANYVTAAEYDHLFSDQLCSFVMSNVNYFSSDAVTSERYNDFRPAAGNIDTESDYPDFRTVFNAYDRSAFEHICDFFECNLWSLAESAVDYVKSTPDPTVEGFRLVFREYDPLLFFDSYFLHWGKCIHERSDELTELRKRDNLFEETIEALYPYAILQAYARAYAHDYDTWGDPRKFFNAFSSYFVPHTPQSKNECLFTARSSFLDQFMRAPKEESLYWAQEYLSPIQDMTDCRKTDEHLIGCFSYSDMLFYMFQIASEKGLRLNRCLNCKKFFFAVKRTDTKYCGRLLHAGTTPVTCRSAGPNFNYEIQRRDSESIRLERKIYNLLRNRHIRHPENQDYKQAFDDFKAENSKRKFQYSATAKLLDELDLTQPNEKFGSDDKGIDSYTAWLLDTLEKCKKNG